MVEFIYETIWFEFGAGLLMLEVSLLPHYWSVVISIIYLHGPILAGCIWLGFVHFSYANILTCTCLLSPSMNLCTSVLSGPCFCIDFWLSLYSLFPNLVGVCQHYWALKKKMPSVFWFLLCSLRLYFTYICSKVYYVFGLPLFPFL